MKITEKCKVIVAGSLVAALMAGTALPALAASPAGDVPFAVLAQQNSAVTPEQVEALISQIGTVTRSRRAAIVAALDAYNPVSYTHLDVYKRQRYLRSGRRGRCTR